MVRLDDGWVPQKPLVVMLIIAMSKNITSALATLRAGEEGQTYVEYALILTMLAVMLGLVTWSGLGTAVQNAVTQVGNAIGA